MFHKSHRHVQNYQQIKKTQFHVTLSIHAVDIRRLAASHRLKDLLMDCDEKKMRTLHAKKLTHQPPRLIDTKYLNCGDLVVVHRPTLALYSNNMLNRMKICFYGVIIDDAQLVIIFA